MVACKNLPGLIIVQDLVVVSHRHTICAHLGGAKHLGMLGHHFLGWGLADTLETN